MSSSQYIHKSHNVSILPYHLVFPAKYSRLVFDEKLDLALKDICLEIEKPKSIAAWQIFKLQPQIMSQLWGSEYWSDGYFCNTVGKHGDENMISRYVKNQGNAYTSFTLTINSRFF